MNARFVKGGFTLIEVLAAMAVLLLIMAIMFQIVEGTLRSSRLVNQQMDATQEARRSLDTVALDIQNRVAAEGAWVFYKPGGQLAFLTWARGPENEDSRCIAVYYEFGSNDEIARSYVAAGWDAVDLSDLSVSASMSAAIRSPIAQGILAVAIVAILEDGSTILLDNLNTDSHAIASDDWLGKTLPADWIALIAGDGLWNDNIPAGLVKVRSLQINLAAANEALYSQLQESGHLDSVRSIFSVPSPGSNMNVSEHWSLQIDSMDDMPWTARSGIRLLTKTVEIL